MVLRQTVHVTMVAVAILASVHSITVAEDATPAVHLEANIARSCYSAHVGFGSFWMSSGDEFDRIDFRDNSLRRVPVRGLQSFHSSVTVGDGAVWLGDARSTIYKIDPQTEQVVKEIRVELDQSPTAAWDLAVGEGAVWVVVGNKKLGRYSAISGADEATISLPCPKR